MQGYFTTKELAVMSIFGCLAALSVLTTFIIPAPLPGFYASIAIILETIFVLTARGIVEKGGAATFTQLVNAVVSLFIPGGPGGCKIFFLPGYIAAGIIIDLLFQATPVGESRAVCGIAGLIHNIPGDFLLHWCFITFLGWDWPLLFFLYGFVAIHAFFGGLAGVFVPHILHRIKPVTG